MRKSLLTRMDDITRCRLFLLMAGRQPAAVLLRRWAGARMAAPGWLRLRAEDNAPACFLATLGTALQAACPTAMWEPVAGLGLEDGLVTVMNVLAEVMQNVVLVVQDYDLIQAAEIHQALAFLIDNQPSCLHVVLVARAAPPLPLPRWRVRRQLRTLALPELFPHRVRSVRLCRTLRT